MNINLSVIPLGVASTGETMYLVSNSANTDDDPSIALVVNETVKNMLIYFNSLYNKASSKVLKCIENHYKAIISGVHLFEEESAETDTPSEFASAPLIGISESVKVGSEDALTHIRYISPGEAARYMDAVIDSSLIEPLTAITTDYAKNPKLWYYVLNKYKSVFTKHIMGGAA